MNRTARSVAIGVASLWLSSTSGQAQETPSSTPNLTPSFSKEQVADGAEIYAVNCAPCHGARMQDPGAAFNLRKFPPDQRERFVNSVTRGKNQMPPWGDFFKPDQLDALWAYVTTGER